MTAITSQLISRKFKFSSSPHIPITPKQLAARDKVQSKLDKGIYHMEECDCFCGHEDCEVISEKERYGLRLNTVICTACGTLRFNPRLDKESLAGFYKDEYRDLYMESARVEESYFLNMIQRGRQILQIVKVHGRLENFSSLRVLEIGCSSGGILIPFLEAGAQVQGFDFDQEYLDYGNQHNPALHLCRGGIDDLHSLAEKYDLIILNHVLEHLADPQGSLRIIEERLAPKGIVYLAVPGLQNPYYYRSPEKSFLGSLHIAHLYHFTQGSLRLLNPRIHTLYSDDDIRMLITFSKEGAPVAQGLNEYRQNLHYIYSYERNIFVKIWRRLPYLIMNLIYGSS